MCPDPKGYRKVILPYSQTPYNPQSVVKSYRTKADYPSTSTSFFRLISAPRYHLPISSRPSLSPSRFLRFASRACARASLFLLSSTPSSRSIASASLVFRGRVLCMEANCLSRAANSASRSARSESVAGRGRFWTDEGLFGSAAEALAA
jgi:hypothetical protein